MTIQEAVFTRCSRRKYLPAPMGDEAVARLQASLAALCEKGDVDMRLVLGDGGAWNGLRKSYGLFSGVRNYAALICRTEDRPALERLGYYGELWVLEATAMGLGTCWVAGSFRRELCPLTLAADERIACTIAVGPVSEALSGKERLVRRVTHRRSKPAAEMSRVTGTPPAWFDEGMRAVQAAPSAMNRQPVLFAMRDGVVSASIANVDSDGEALDFGIAKLHFELGAGGGSWAWGNHGAFTRFDTGDDT